MRQRSRPAVPDDAAVVDYFLELGGGFLSLFGCQIGFAANVGRIEAGEIVEEIDQSVLNGRRG